MKLNVPKIITATLVGLAAFASTIQASTIPKPVLVAYWENWGSLKLTDLHDDINVVQLAFATTVGTSLYDMTFSNGPYASDADMEADIDLLHAEGKKVILSIGGAADPIFLANTTEKNTFVTTMKAILARFNNKIDGIDIDIESTSFDFGSTWTASSPAAGGQHNLIDATKELMAYHSDQTGEHFLLTMAPETVYIVGALSSWQMTNANGGAMIPIIEALRDSLDLLHAQLYNAYESVAIDGRAYRNDGDADYVTSMIESIIKGFTLPGDKGIYGGFPASKVAIALPANSCDQYSEGWVTPADVVKAAQYIKGDIAKPTGWSYTMTTSYPDLAGLMTWSANEDYKNCKLSWEFANNFTLAFDMPTTVLSSPELNLQGVEFNLDESILILGSASEMVSVDKWQLTNINGTQVASFSKQDVLEGVNLSHLEPGVYFVTTSQLNINYRVIFK